MANRFYRCGSSNDILRAPIVHQVPREVRKVPRDRATPRLLTALHFEGTPAVERGFRVIAELEGGGCSLVCLGATREEALIQARAQARRLTSGVRALVLQRWVGTSQAGHWRTLRRWAGKLPAPRRLRPLSNRPRQGS
jgi:hypothetical protein